METTAKHSVNYSVVDLTSTVLVTRSKRGFEVQHLESGKTEYISSTKLEGSCFKYPTDFIRAFSKCFPEAQNIMLSTSANDYMIELLTFNRIDS